MLSQPILVATIVMGICISSLYFSVVIWFSLGKTEARCNHKFWGLIPKPVAVTDNLTGDVRYALRVYSFWGLRGTQWYLSEHSKYKDWDMCKLDKPHRIFFKTSAGVSRLLDNLKPLESKLTIETRTIEELKMEDLLEDKGSD